MPFAVHRVLANDDTIHRVGGVPVFVKESSSDRQAQDPNSSVPRVFLG